MELMPNEVRQLLPPLYTNEEKDPADIKVPLKVFDPAGRFTYYATEFDGEDTLFGFCVSPLGPDCDELGYQSLAELESTRNRFRMLMERDLFWDPETSLADVMSEKRR